MNEINEMNETQEMTEMREMYETMIAELESKVQELTQQLENRSKTEGRKFQVLEFMKMNGPSTIKDIAKGLGISTKNVSSQLTYLRTDGYEIFTDNNGKKFLN
jgi:Fic family protein